MRPARELFFSLVREVEQSGQFSHILEKQQLKYQLQSFKLQGIDSKAIRRIYQTLEKKYFQTRELSVDPDNWNENQRRVFIWYIIFYTYFLSEKNEDLNRQHWSTLSSIFFNKSEEFLKFQYLNMIKTGKIFWSQEEDQLLTESVQHEGAGRWNEVAKYFFFSSNFNLFKSPKHCRQRWLNHLDYKKKHGDWTPEEDLVIFDFVSENGKRWCKLVPLLNDSRTEHMIKNRYNSLVNKQRRGKKEREELCISKIKKQLRKQIEINERKKQKREGSEVKMQSQERLEKEQYVSKEWEPKEEQKSFVKREEVPDASFDAQLLPSQKTISCEKQPLLKEQNQVDYIRHELKDQKTIASSIQIPKVKSEQFEAHSINHNQQAFDYNTSYPFADRYNDLAYGPTYPCYWY